MIKEIRGTIKNHPLATGGNVEISRNVSLSSVLLHNAINDNDIDEETLEETLKRAARCFGFTLTMDAQKICSWLRENKKLTNQDIQQIEMVNRYK
jgi:hypothetical protein